MYHIEPVPLTTARGLVTGTKTKVLGEENYLETVTYYDDEYQVIQVINENILDGIDVISTQYDFVGNIRRLHSVHSDGAQTTTQLLTYDYDHSDRLLSATHTLNEQGPVVLYSNEYNELGELIRKNLHQADATIPAVPGMNFSYYELDQQYSFLPDFSPLEPVHTGMTEAIEITFETRPTWFGVRYSGYIEIETSDLYEFYVASNDGSILYIDGIEVVNNDGRHVLREESGSIHLTEGFHEIVVEMFQSTGTFDLSASYSSPSIPKQEIPSTMLYQELPITAMQDVVQTCDYEYNMRGWLRTINGTSLNGDDVPVPADLFNMELIYNTEISNLPNN